MFYSPNINCKVTYRINNDDNKTNNFTQVADHHSPVLIDV